ncbi:MAG: GNAT family N-acetyltransferase [Chloroflexi bacterium]|nr:GNAT family N-acetyltransferase [Chloroflexota bacterium]
MSAADTIFLTPWWQEIWWRHFGGQVQQMVLTVEDGNSLLGIAPLIRQGETIYLMGDPDLFDHQDFLPVSNQEDAFYNGMFDYLCSQEWKNLSLRSLRPTSTTLKHLPELCKRHGFTFHIEEDGETPAVTLPKTWDEYVASLEKKKRHELRRKIRRLEAAGTVRQRTCTSPAGLSRDMDQFFELMRASRDDKRQFLTAEREAFFRDIATESAERGQFHLSFLELNEECVAACIAFDYGDAYLLYNSGFNPAYASLSVGLINKAFCLREAIEAGKHTFDFLKGPERYKFDLGGVNQLLYRIEVSR